ncbi:MAG: hypothetical protein COC06_12010 [Bacteroidales bacterium]|nr:MAG: hypothetical protein COC06_12010 [Bacteroidales bacterium]
MSASNQNDCPLGSGMPVRYKTEWVSVFIRILHLTVPRSQYDENRKETEVSKEVRKKFLFNREAFIQLNTVLGAYLMYRKHYNALSEIWFYTQSQPPRYILIPQSVQYLFELFNTFLRFEIYMSDIIIRFSFKDLSFDEMNNKLDVKYVVCQYIGLLFLRLYIAPRYYGEHQLNYLPQIPEKQDEKIKWQENLDVFKTIIEKHLKNENFLNELGLNVITKDKCKEWNIPYPTEYIENLVVKIKDGFKETLKKTPLSSEKIAKLKSSTVYSIECVYKDIVRINRQNEIDKSEKDSISDYMEVIRGTRNLLSREAFLDNTSTHYIGVDTILGESIRMEYYRHLATKFHLIKKMKTYEVANGQIFEAIKKLSPVASEYILVSFGVNINYYKDLKGVTIEDSKGDENYRFMSIPIYCFDINDSLVRNTIFLVKNTSKPMVKHGDWTEIKDLPQKSFERWSVMEKLNEELNIYCGIKELNTDSDLRTEYLNLGKKEEEINNMIEFDVDFLAYIWFRKDSEIIEIKEAEIFQEGEVNNKLEDINPLDTDN